MRIAFFGSPEFVIPILSYLHKAFGVTLVVTQPDKPVGRKGILTPTPIKEFALKESIPCIASDTMIHIIEAVKKENVDVAVVAAYGQIIPKELLEIPKFGFINIHYSLLPKYRGASPVQTAIVNGEKMTGTTIMRMDEELDHGEIIAQKEVNIENNDTSETLLNKLNEASLPILDKALRTIEITGKLPPMTEQDHNQATFTRRLTKDDGFINFQTLKEALIRNTKYEILNTIHNLVRGYFPWPGAWTKLPNGKRLKLISSEIKVNKLVLREVQLEGKQKTADINFLKEFFM